MKKHYILLILVSLITLSFVGFYKWGMRPMMQNVVLLSSEMKGDYVVSEMSFVEINGVELWVTIRGTDKKNPVLLVVHGGPGKPQTPFQRRYDARLIEQFTVVHFDQRGSGKSFDAITDSSQWSISQFKRDTIAVIEYALTRLDKKKLSLVGHSWGSVLGIEVAYERPDLLHAYIGVTQLSHLEGFPDFSLSLYGKEPKVAKRDEKIGLFLSPDYSKSDIKRYHKGFSQSVKNLKTDSMSVDIRRDFVSFDIPIYFLLGRQDLAVSSDISAIYMKRIIAPEKRIVWFEKSAHFPFMEEPKKYTDVLVELLY